MENKNIFHTLFFGFHIFLVISVAGISAYDSFVQFYKINTVDREAYFYSFFSRIINSDFCRFYAQLSGTDTGYGFYAPNVKAGAVVQLEIDNNIFLPTLDTHEGNHMLNTLIGGMTNRIIEQSEETQVKHEELNLETRLNELCLKNIAIYFASKGIIPNDTQEFKLHYCIVLYPSLADHVPGNTTPEIVRVKTINLTRQFTEI